MWRLGDVQVDSCSDTQEQILFVSQLQMKTDERKSWLYSYQQRGFLLLQQHLCCFICLLVYVTLLISSLFFFFPSFLLLPPLKSFYPFKPIINLLSIQSADIKNSDANVSAARNREKITIAKNMWRWICKVWMQCLLSIHVRGQRLNWRALIRMDFFFFFFWKTTSSVEEV